MVKQLIYPFKHCQEADLHNFPHPQDLHHLSRSAFSSPGSLLSCKDALKLKPLKGVAAPFFSTLRATPHADLMTSSATPLQTSVDTRCKTRHFLTATGSLTVTKATFRSGCRRTTAPQGAPCILLASASTTGPFEASRISVLTPGPGGF